MPLPKRYDPRESEPRWQRFWEQQGVFRFDHEDRTREIYSVDTPPPTVSGAIHMGHVFSYVQAEAIARFWRQRGHNVFYPFGFDDNGLPTERFVEKKLKLRAGAVPRSEFIDKCLALTREVEGKFKELWQSLGFSCDWSLEYSTIDERSQRISQRSFLDLYRKNLVYRKEQPALWCTECRTAVAQAEEDDVESETLFSDIPFELEDGGRLVIATTRPELLPSCVCVFVHPDDEKNRELIGKTATVPLFGQHVPVLANDSVDKDKGTGVVMCCTFGDTADIDWWERFGLPLRISIGHDGKLNDLAGSFGGMKIRDARKAILEELARQGLILAQRTISHTVNTHERCGTPIEFLPAKQWFIKVLDYKQQLLEAGNRIRWYPKHMKVRYDHWVENLHWDWGISRQRFYGVPIPVWYCTGCEGIVPASESQLPVDPALADPPGPCPGCSSTELEPEKDVMDTWATSSVTPQINLRWGEESGDISDRLMPMTLRPQAHDIIRTWAFYTIVKSLHHTGDIPWRDAMISGHVIDAERQKISKSKQTALSRVFFQPEQTIQRFSADAVRYWACRANLGVDTAYDEQMIQQGKRFVTKLWNASRFALSHLEDWDGGPGKPTIIDRGLIAAQRRVAARATAHLEVCEIGAALREVESFFWSVLCDNYLEMVKVRIYEAETWGEASRRAAQSTLYRVVHDTLRLLAPFMPHITEEIYQAGLRERAGDVSIHVSRWPAGEDVADTEASAAFDGSVDVITAVRKHKSEANLSMGAELECLQIGAEGQLLPALEGARAELTSTSRARQILIEPGDGEPTTLTESGVPLWIR